MPWYRLTAYHGPGHQSTMDSYHWYDFEMNEEILQETFEYLTRELQGPTGLLRKVDRLPKDVRMSKVMEYRQRKAHAESVLAELGEKPMKTDEYIAWLITLRPIEIAKNLERITGEFCVGCGGPVLCQCRNDE